MIEGLKTFIDIYTDATFVLLDMLQEFVARFTWPPR